ncbi:diphthamide biosynthesis enzyme Dph2 [Methanothermococcus sp. SCGC AD-155-C09]|nr:diphthamide biosynthesis enzyme Dph2 [Methanothermococcus sp. SCGC AD-155-C09]
MWDLERNRVINEIIKYNAKRVLFQGPEGLKRNMEREIEDIVKYFRGKGRDVELILWGGSSFGACDICDIEVKHLNIDLILHYGHEELPYSKSEMPIIYIPVYYSPDREHLMGIINDINKILKKQENLPIIATTIQFKKILREYNPTVILGCRTNINEEMVKDKDIIYIGSGRFHPLMLAYKFKREITLYNPITRNYSKIEKKDVDKFIKRRLGAIYKLHIHPPKKIGVVLSTKRGQCRINVFNNIIKTLRKKNINYVPIVLNNISPESLIYDVDAYILCACPRIVLDDHINYKKVLLTPKEFEMYINNNFNYVFDEVFLDDFIY